MSETCPTAVLRHADAGEWEQAAEHADRTAGGTGALSARTAWPTIMVLYLQGRLEAAESVRERVAHPPDPADDVADRALLAAWAASVAWARGEVPACRAAADRALSLAPPGSDPRALAAVHTVLALLAAAEGDRRGNDRHYALALAAAVAAGDRTQQLRIRANRASQRLEEGDLAGALAELDEALGLTRGGAEPHPAMVGLAQHNRADLLLRGGRPRAARDGFRAARTTLQRAGAGSVAYPLTGLGESYELCGDLPQARAAYEEAVLVAEGTGITQALVPALCGLARVLAATGDAGAVPTAARALAASTGLTEPAARVAMGWAVLESDPAAAREHAERAIGLARTGRNPAALADGLELAAMTHPGAAADPLLADAARVGTDIGDPVAVARVALTRARRGAGRSPAAARIIAERTLLALGVESATGTRSLAPSLWPQQSPVTVRMLGSFAVLHGGESVTAATWQSRKARDLLKLLVARRGRPISREAIGEALWPGENAVANRLSITLSILRTVLDPTRSVPPDHYVVTGPAGVAYDPHTLTVDVDVFLQLAAAGTAALAAGRTDEARALLEAADAAYAGAVLDDEPDLEAVRALRDEARTGYLAAMRALGAACAEAGDTDAAVQAWRRLLDQDPYDEDGALRMVDVLTGSGRHGEAARRYRIYTTRMRELGVPPAPMRRRAGRRPVS
ncbi:BTAD domain-containing putative transcriptional regulator [Actinoplanes sp. NPDC049668]|uniref:BTAD domain-containing putative transcriptional regulator n=1 Tax=unclassified Actinoplanes TaxID=2626549 RepID=UPI0033B40756